MHNLRFNLQKEIKFKNLAKRVLVIDDEENIREIVQISLELNTNWSVTTAASGTKGVAMAKATQPDVILLDVVMPEEDGLTIFHKLQACSTTQHIPVLFFTAKIHKSELQPLLDMGVKGVMEKPFNPMTLANELAGYLAGNSLNKIQHLALAS